MVKEIILIILLFNGEVSLPSLPFEGTMHECFEHGDKLREELSIHRWVEEDIMKSGWYLKNGIGTFHGFMCI
jgi:hypothetical protein